MNWYSYCGNNPVMFVDPSGLCADCNDLIDESHEYCITRNVQMPAVQVSFNGDNARDAITITAYVKFSGEMVNKMTSEGMTYRQATIYGIENSWSGSYDGREVIVKVVDLTDILPCQNNMNQHYIDISINNVRSTSSISNAGTRGSNYQSYIEMYIGDGRFSNSHRYSWYDYTITSGHEFGHVLGLGDMYNSKYNNIRNIESIMNSQFKWPHAQKVDYYTLFTYSTQNRYYLYNYDYLI